MFHPRLLPRRRIRLQFIFHRLGDKLPQRYPPLRRFRFRPPEYPVRYLQRSLHNSHIPIFMGHSQFRPAPLFSVPSVLSASSVNSVLGKTFHSKPPSTVSNPTPAKYHQFERTGQTSRIHSCGVRAKGIISKRMPKKKSPQLEQAAAKAAELILDLLAELPPNHARMARSKIRALATRSSSSSNSDAHATSTCTLGSRR